MSREAISDESLKEEFERLSKEFCDGDAPTQKVLKKEGQFSISPYRDRFGSWNKAVEEYGFISNRTTEVSKEKLKDDYIDSCSNSDNILNMPQFSSAVEYSLESFLYDYFDSWKEFVNFCGFESYDKKEYTRDEIIQEMKTVDQKTEDNLTYRSFEKASDISSETVYNHFNGWNKALEAAGLQQNQVNIPKEKIIREIEYISTYICNGNKPTMSIIKEHGRYSISQYRRFGWRELLRECGFRDIDKQISTEELKNDIRRVSNEYCDGNRPFLDDIDKYGKFSPPTYINRFSGWDGAVKECGFEAFQPLTGKDNPTWKGGYGNYYGPSWREQRRKAWEKDEYQCQICGKGKEEIGKNPDVHHIVPVRFWTVEDEHEKMNSLENIVSLCKSCHSKYGRKKKLYKNTRQTFLNEVKEMRENEI